MAMLESHKDERASQSQALLEMQTESLQSRAYLKHIVSAIKPWM